MQWNERLHLCLFAVDADISSAICIRSDMVGMKKPVFPLPNRDALWFEVHELGVTIGKEENLTYHQSRHSFGTFLISADIPIESIAKMMGHSNIRTTQGYARITDDKISKDMDKLIERRKEISAGEKKKQ